MSEQTTRCCAVDGCERTDIAAKGVCHQHRLAEYRPNAGRCYFEGCTELRTKGANHGYCRAHLDEYLATRLCAQEGCTTRAAIGNAGLCSRCYRQGLAERRKAVSGSCSIDGCNRPVGIDWSSMCDRHHRKKRAADQRALIWPLILAGKIEPEGRFIDQHGYVRLRYQGFQELEHRVIIAKSIGRRLTSSENVHHRNGVRHDNRFDNLELWLKAQPQGVRLQDRIREAESLLFQHKPDALTTHYFTSRVDTSDEAAA